MKNTHPKKFALIGLPGSGKSTFASKLGKILDIPVHHLDRHMFEPGGKYSIDVDWRIPNIGYYWKEASQIVGFSIIETIDGYSEIVDFYVVPAYRKKMVGKNMAFAVFNKHPGPWRIRQIPGSEAAAKFWRKVISEYTNGNYTEMYIDNPPWGLSVCQQFYNQISHTP